MAELQERLLLRQEQLDKEIATLDLKVEAAVAEWKQANDADSKAFYSKRKEELVARQERLDELRRQLQEQLAVAPPAVSPTAPEVSVVVDKTVVLETDEVPPFKADIRLVHGKVHIATLKELLAGRKRVLQTINGQVVQPDKDGYSNIEFNDQETIKIKTELKPGTKIATAYAAADKGRRRWWQDQLGLMLSDD